MTAPHRHRLLVFAHSTQLAGAERALLGLVRAVVRRDVVVRVIVPKQGPLVELLRDAGAEVVRCPLPPWMARKKAWVVFLGRAVIALVLLPRLLFLTWRFRPCLAYTNSWVVPEGALVSRLLRVPHVWHLREFDPGEGALRTRLPAKVIRQLTSAWSTAFLVVSAAVAEQFDPAGKLGSRLRVVQVGVEEVSIDAADGAVPSPDGAPTVLVLGTISEAKGTFLALEAMRHLRSWRPNARLLIVGEGTFRVVRALKDRISELQLDDAVQVHGFVGRPETVVVASDVVVVPSRSEAYGLVTVEAMSLGKPVVGAARGGTRELLAGGGGLLATVDDPRHFASHIDAVIEDPQLSAWLGQRGRVTAAALDKEAEGLALMDELERLCRR